MPAAIQVEDLQKNYGSHRALKGIDFSIEHGEVVGFLGPNGAGKTTAMRILTGYFAPSGGSARIEGHDVLAESLEARRCIGYLPESPPIYPDMRVRDYLEYAGRIRGLGKGERAKAIERVAEQCAITDRLGQKVGELSKGYRQRAGMAQAMLHEPNILIMDEPTTGLDPNQIVEIRNLIREVGRHKTVLLSTHILSEVQAVCDRVIIIHRGQLVADGPTHTVTTSGTGGHLLSVTYAPGKVAPDAERVLAAVKRLPHVERATPLQVDDPGHFSFEVMATADVRADLFKLASSEGLTMVELTRQGSNLEEVFRRLTNQ